MRKLILVALSVSIFSGCTWIAEAMLIRESWQYHNRTGKYAPTYYDEKGNPTGK